MMSFVYEVSIVVEVDSREHLNVLLSTLETEYGIEHDEDSIRIT